MGNQKSVSTKLRGRKKYLTEDLIKINEQKRKEKWEHYDEKVTTMEIYGSTKK